MIPSAAAASSSASSEPSSEVFASSVDSGGGFFLDPFLPRFGGLFLSFGGGLGAQSSSDGLNHGNSPISTATMPSVEMTESAYPLIFTHFSLRPDSAGCGRYRGGYGAVYEIENRYRFKSK